MFFWCCCFVFFVRFIFQFNYHKIINNLTLVLMSKTEVKLLYCGPVHSSLDSQHVQLLLQASSVNTTNIVPTKFLCPSYLFQI